MFLDEKAEEYFLLYSHLKSHQNKVIKSIDIIRRYLEQCNNPYLSWSTGKDSTVVLSLLRLIDKEMKVPVIHFDLGVELPGTDEYKKRFKNITTYSSEKTIIQMMNEYGFECNEARKSNLLDDIISKFDYDGHMMGLRYDESSARKNLYKLGHTYKKNNGLLVCNPIYNWNLNDIFAYLISSNIPIHPHYYKKSSQPLEQRRVGGYLSSRNRGSEFGRFYWFKEQYPNEFLELSKNFPKINNYV